MGAVEAYRCGCEQLVYRRLDMEVKE